MKPFKMLARLLARACADMHTLRFGSFSHRRGSRAVDRLERRARSAARVSLSIDLIPMAPEAGAAEEVAMHAHITVVDHPLIAHKLSLMRDVTTGSAKFRQLLKEISLLLGYEVLRDLPTELRSIETPLQSMEAPFLKGKKLVFVPILRAGIGLLDGLLELVPSARVGHIGLYRDPDTLMAVEYYAKLPDELAERQVILVDPMLATGNSVAAAVTRLKEAGAVDIKFVCLLAAPEGIGVLKRAHPDVKLFTAAIDARLNDHGYIVPGLGDAGDRLFGTK